MLRKSKFRNEYSNGMVSGISLKTFSDDSIPQSVPQSIPSTAAPTSPPRIVPNLVNHNPSSKDRIMSTQGHTVNYNSCSSSSSTCDNSQVTFKPDLSNCNNNNNDITSPTILITNNDHHKPQKCAITVRGVNLSYQESILSSLKGTSRSPPVFVLNGLNLTVPVGSIYGLLGPSGCGKTSLLRCM